MGKRSYSSASDQQERKPQEFDLDGVTFVATGSVSMLDISEFARMASQGMDSGSPEAIGFLADIYRGLLGDQEYRRFREHCRQHLTKGDVLIEVLGDLAAEQVKDETGRPTGRSSDSSDGPPNAPDTQTVVSFSRATVETRPVEETKPAVSYG